MNYLAFSFVVPIVVYAKNNTNHFRLLLLNFKPNLQKDDVKLSCESVLSVKLLFSSDKFNNKCQRLFIQFFWWLFIL